jgi:hypothetical protein
MALGSRFTSIAFALLPLAALADAGCARTPQVQVESLALKRVVIYRNGVGYFERGGHVEGSEVRFKMKESEVGDFLATLAVMEQGGSSVKAAAFPLDVDDEVNKDDADADVKKPPKTEDEKRGLKKVVLALDGKAHEIEVGYIASAPVWRPSYRLVVHKDGQADLQAWGIVQNLSGEDWENVKLSLVAGAPLSFEAQLGTAVIPTRPTVTDQGEVIAAVPRAETSLAQAPEPPPPPAAAADLAPMDENESPAEAKEGRSSGAGAARMKKAPSKSANRGPTPGAPMPMPASAAPAPQQWMESRRSISAPRDLRSLAAVAVEAGTTRYDLPESVTVPDKSATMVMLLSKKVPGEAIFLFAPEGGVPDSMQHPFRVARFSNKTGGTLERGPIAVFEEGAFLGQGMVDPLPDAATATVPFALERSLAIDSERKYEELGERIHQIENGELTIDRDAQTKSKYRIRNGGDLAAKVIVKHARMSGTRLVSPPKDTEDNVGTSSALVPTMVAPRATAELVVDERAMITRHEDWFSAVADNAVKAFLADPRSDHAVAAKLGTAWGTRKEIVDKQQTRAKLAEMESNLASSQEETRRNLRAIEKNKSADALRAKLTQRLGEMATKIDDLTRQIVELDAKLAELRVLFKETIREINFVAPAKAAGA